MLFGVQTHVEQVMRNETLTSVVEANKALVPKKMGFPTYSILGLVRHLESKRQRRFCNEKRDSDMSDQLISRAIQARYLHDRSREFSHQAQRNGQDICAAESAQICGVLQGTAQQKFFADYTSN